MSESKRYIDIKAEIVWTNELAELSQEQKERIVKQMEDSYTATLTMYPNPLGFLTTMIMLKFEPKAEG